jgi:hypothetical protein
MFDTPSMVTLETHHSARLLFHSRECIWAFGCGNPKDAVEYRPAGIEQDVCQWCAGCGANLSPHLGVAGCMLHGEHCATIRQWFLRTKAALDFCRFVWVRTGEVIDISTSPLWRRAMHLWSLEQLAGADGLELFERVMSELAE